MYSVLLDEYEYFGSSMRSVVNHIGHSHTYYEIEMIYKGEIIETVNGEKIKCTDGTVILLAPGDFHSLKSETGEATVFKNCNKKSSDMLPKMLELMKQYPPPYVIKLEDNSFKKFNTIFDILFSAIEGKNVSTKKIAEDLLFSLCIDEVVKGRNLMSPVTNYDNNKKAILDICSYIEENYMNRISRDELAEKYNFSPTYLSKLFKKCTGFSIFEHIVNVRMQNAIWLINNTDKPIGTIIKEVGYNSESLFYEHFKECFGTVPKKIK